MRSSLGRGGFVLPWIIMSVAVLAILAAVVAPSVVSILDRQRALEAAKTLGQITAGIVAFENTVHSSSSGSSSNYPGQVSQLAILLSTAPGVADKNSCQLAMTTHDSTDWIANGPFVPMYIPPTGLWTPIGRILDSIPKRNNPTDPFYILIPGVDSLDAALLDQVVDHGTGDTVSALHAVINDTTTVTYRALSTGQVLNKC